MGFGVWGLGFGVWGWVGLGFRVWGSGFGGVFSPRRGCRRSPAQMVASAPPLHVAAVLGVRLWGLVGRVSKVGYGDDDGGAKGYQVNLRSQQSF